MIKNAQPIFFKGLNELLEDPEDSKEEYDKLAAIEHAKKRHEEVKLNLSNLRE